MNSRTDKKFREWAQRQPAERISTLHERGLITNGEALLGLQCRADYLRELQRGQVDPVDADAAGALAADAEQKIEDVSAAIAERAAAIRVGDITKGSASGPGALDHWVFSCSCGTRHRSTMKGQVSELRREHVAWHLGRGDTLIVNK